MILISTFVFQFVPINKTLTTVQSLRYLESFTRGVNLFIYVLIYLLICRALASHQCGPGSVPGPGVICGLSLLLVLVPAPRVFLRVLRFSSLHKNQHFQIPIRSGIRGPQVCQSRDCYVLPSLNIVDLFLFIFIYCSYRLFAGR